MKQSQIRHRLLSISRLILMLFLTVLMECQVKCDADNAPDAVPESRAMEASDCEKTVRTLSEPTQLSDDSSHKNDSCQYWGNSYSLKFHRKICPFAQAMNPKHVQLLKSAQQAISMGERPCRYCLPPYWTDVQGVILSTNGQVKTGASSPHLSPAQHVNLRIEVDITDSKNYQNYYFSNFSLRQLTSSSTNDRLESIFAKFCFLQSIDLNRKSQ